MTDRANLPSQEHHAPSAGRALRRIGGGIVTALEILFSRRGLCVLFFLVAATLVGLGWLRPSLSPDLSGLNLGLPIGDGQASPPESVVYGPRSPRALSLGGVLLLVLAGGLAAILWRPHYLGAAAGLFLTTALAANAAAIFNYPTLVELLDLEQEQRQLMATVLPSPVEGEPLATKQDTRTRGVPAVDGRVSAAPVRDQERGALLRGWYYLLYAPYLVYLAALGVLVGTRGTLGRRLAHLAAWAGAGCLLAGLLCLPRLRAEFHWQQAKRLEAQADFRAARQELDRAIDLFPAFGQMQRTWLLAGRLDYREGKATAQERVFRAFQYRRRKDWPRVLALMGEIPSGTPSASPPVHHQMARFAAAAGLSYYHNGRLGAAEDLWQRTIALAPEVRDCRLLLAVTQARLDPARPDRVEASLEPLLGRALADQPLRADALVILANALFKAGRVNDARRRYAESLDLFSIPRIVNFRAAKGLGGL